MVAPYSIRNDALNDGPYGPESDSCAIYLSARKFGQSTFGTLKRSIGALIQMGHRTGFVNGEGDGAGVQTDIPAGCGRASSARSACAPRWPRTPASGSATCSSRCRPIHPELHDRIQAAFDAAGLNLIYQQPGRTRREALGGNGRLDPPAFWQIAGYVEFSGVEKRLLEVQMPVGDRVPHPFPVAQPARGGL